MILYFVATYWILISALAICMNLRTFKKYQRYADLTKLKSEWDGIMRTDYASWNKTKIIIGSFTILPIKFFALANFLVGALTFAILISLTNEGSTRRTLAKACTWYFNNYGKLMNNIALKIEDNCPNAQDCVIKTPIVISNHSCWFDTFYITLKYSPISYVAKYQIQFWPIIGPVSKAMNCIFVKRENQKDRNYVREAIQKRIEDFENNKFHAFPLMIYPQGTTSNNRVILNFKSGAFENLSPVTLICIKYQCDNCLLGQDQLQQSQHIFLMLSQFTKLKATKIQMKPLPNEKHEQYMERCRQVMAKTLQFPKVNLGYRDRLQLAKFRTQYVKTQ